MISRVNSVNFRGAQQTQTQNNPSMLTRAKAFTNNMVDKFVGQDGQNKDKALNAASIVTLAGAIVTAAGMLTKSRALKIIGLAGTFASAAASLAINKHTKGEPQTKEVQEPALIEVPVSKEETPATQEAELAPKEEPQAQEEAIRAAEDLAKESLKPSPIPALSTSQG